MSFVCVCMGKFKLWLPCTPSLGCIVGVLCIFLLVIVSGVLSAAVWAALGYIRLLTAVCSTLWQYFLYMPVYVVSSVFVCQYVVS